jgi:hypothetical protein
MSSVLQKDRLLPTGNYWISGHTFHDATEAVAYLTSQGFSMDDACEYLMVLIDELQKEGEAILAASRVLL